MRLSPIVSPFCLFSSLFSLILLPLCSGVMSLLFWCCGVLVTHLCEQTMWAWRCAPAQAQPGMFQHSGALGWEGPNSPSAAQPPVPWPHLLVLWPLSLPPRHSFIFLSLTQFLTNLFSSLYPLIKLYLFLLMYHWMPECIQFGCIFKHKIFLFKCRLWICFNYLMKSEVTSMQWLAFDI